MLLSLGSLPSRKVHVLGLTVAAVGLSGLGFAAASARATSIGINYTGAGSYGQTQAQATGGYSLAPTASAGYAAVAQDNWNNTTISYTDGNGHGNSGLLSTVVDSTGATVSGMSVATAVNTSDSSYTGDPLKLYPDSGTASWGFSGNNLTMLEGDVYPSPKITISGIPYSSYDVYVYMAAPGGNAGVGAVTISANSVGTVDSTSEYFYDYIWPAGTFIQATATSATANTVVSNFVLFTGNTASDITLTADASGWNTGLAAFQIVNTGSTVISEPATLILMALGGLGVVLMGRKRQTAQ